MNEILAGDQGKPIINTVLEIGAEAVKQVVTEAIIRNASSVGGGGSGSHKNAIGTAGATTSIFQVFLTVARIIIFIILAVYIGKFQ